MFSFLLLLVLVLLILCLARRGKKTVSYPDLDKELVKETMGGTDLEAFGEKDVTHFDLKFLQVTPDGYVVKDEDVNLPDVTQDAIQCRPAPLAKMPEGLSIGDFINSNIKKVDQQHQDIDDVRHYNITGDNISVAASLSSLASGFNSTTGSSKSDVPFDYKSDWGQRFEKIAQIYNRESDLEDDSELDYSDVPRERKVLSSISSTSKDTETLSSHPKPPPMTKAATATSNTTTTATTIGPASSNRVAPIGQNHMPKAVDSTATLTRNKAKKSTDGDGQKPNGNAKTSTDVINVGNLHKGTETWC